MRNITLRGDGKEALKLDRDVNGHAVLSTNSQHDFIIHRDDVGTVSAWLELITQTNASEAEVEVGEQSEDNGHNDR